MFLSYVAKFNGSTLYSESVIPDSLGRITQKTETVGTETHVWGYTYDPAGRPTDVTKDGSAVSHYGYDGDDNRTTFTGPGGTVNPTYDAQDRLLTYGGATYAYTPNGERTTKTVGTRVTSSTYDALGNLVHVGLPGGTSIDYVVDEQNLRVGKKLGGTRRVILRRLSASRARGVPAERQSARRARERERVGVSDKEVGMRGDGWARGRGGAPGATHAQCSERRDGGRLAG